MANVKNVIITSMMTMLGGKKRGSNNNNINNDNNIVTTTGIGKNNSMGKSTGACKERASKYAAGSCNKDANAGKTVTTIPWSEIRLGDEFVDGSKVTEIHDKGEYVCYELTIKRKDGNGSKGGIHLGPKNVNSNNANITDDVDTDTDIDTMILSEDHMLLVNLQPLSSDLVESLRTRLSSVKIPTEYDTHIKIDALGFCHEEMEITAWGEAIRKDSVWLTVSMISELIRQGEKIESGSGEIIESKKLPGIKTCFCVSTDSHQYETNGVIHHNSVTLRNIIIHCLTHSDDMVLALVDLKKTEFTPFRGIRGVLAVANTIPESLEILRVARECMYKRNLEMSKLGIANIADYHPTQYSGKISIFGRPFDENFEFDVKINGKEQKKTALEIFNILNNKELQKNDDGVDTSVTTNKDINNKDKTKTTQ